MNRLDVGDGHSIAYEVHGAGPAAVVLHGGPGSGSNPTMASLFDGVVLFDQRQCGSSTPHAADGDGVDVAANTTEHLLADIERLREHLGVDRWLVHGHSWGSALGLLYTERHPERVSALVVSGVALGRRAEIDWLYRGGLAAERADAWGRFVDGVEGDPIEWYAAQLADPGTAVDAAARWSEWDWATASDGAPPRSWLDPRFQVARARICAHYFLHDCWLDDDAILGGAGGLRGVPGAIVNGARDLQTPVDGARALADGWPDAELVVVDDAGHAVGEALRRAIARWTRRGA